MERLKDQCTSPKVTKFFCNIPVQGSKYFNFCSLNSLCLSFYSFLGLLFILFPFGLIGFKFLRQGLCIPAQPWIFYIDQGSLNQKYICYSTKKDTK